MSTKSSVLSALKSSQDYLSGEALAESCKVSRTAIWKAIRSLEEDGFKIDAVTNKGYKLIQEPDILSAASIGQYLEKKGFNNIKIFTYEEIDSTNSQAKRTAADIGAFRDASGELTQKAKSIHPALFVSESQTGGKGRLGRVFHSPKNTGIYFSLLYSPTSSIKNPALYTAAAAVSVAKAILKIYGKKCLIKWVNDIFLDEKKVCGILVEGISNFESGNIDAAVIGIGINIRHSQSTQELAKIAGSIEDGFINSGEEFPSSSKNILVAQVVKNLISYYSAFDKNDVKATEEMIQEYRNLSMLKGKTVMVNPVAGLQGKSFQAKVKDIDKEIKLVVEDKKGKIISLSSGEVSLHSYDFM